jgi:DNA-binding NarL/FixJ family response regulator
MEPPQRTLSQAVERERDATLSLVPPAAQLTHREVDVLQLIAEGLANHEIGKRLFLSEETVKSHVKTLLEKLHARTRAHAVAIALRCGLLT